MAGRQLAWVFAWTMACLCSTAAGQIAPPDVNVFARAEDQARARHLEQPCTEADLGQGCYRASGLLVREYPCSYRDESGETGLLPTDQCYKMEAPRRFRGVWVDEFEGQQFIEEGTTAPEWPRSDPPEPEWRERFDQARAATIWLDVSRVDLGRRSRGDGRRFRVEFVGRQTMYPGHYGHMGMSGQEITVDRMISIEECPSTGVCG